MIDTTLALLPQWRFCQIPRGEKGPRYRDWQLKPYTLDQVADNSNIGVILGPVSGGLLAIDFDGPWTWEYWQENISIPFDSFDTVMWASGKPGRCQMAFTVPSEAWPIMPNFKVRGPAGDDGRPQMLEVRWGTDSAGLQSVVPPSLHPDNARDPTINYQWLRSPEQVGIAEIPVALLEWIVNYQAPPPPGSLVAVPMPDIKRVKTADYDHLVALLQQLKRYYGRPDHDTWIRYAFAVASEVGPGAAALIMNDVWPEEKRNEYNRLLRTFNPARSPRIGSLEYLVKQAIIKRKIL
jgi:hypothetical protein